MTFWSEDKPNNSEIASGCSFERLQNELELIELELENASDYVRTLLECRKDVLSKKKDMMLIYGQISEEELADIYQDEYYNKKMGH
ncbi:hypothetical protein [Paenibacillus oleatilyticus]|uniref:hypothetical protein n=1 Tax=Paenibacillus oleatilyticus TaxID=2594886 RepID=UPI001C1FFF8D|nr:hypothetical protein [Paenibacillus oleatilyticus]MBU7316059.1 hypothetical protein [Paenibacillus oleatilyticus]